MKDTDFDRFSALLVVASEVYGRAVSQALAAVYWQTLAPYPIDAVEGALHSHLADPDAGQFFPKPADLIRHISGTRTDQAKIAWGKVMQAIRRVGAYGDVVFDDPLIHLAITDQGGWPKVCRTNIDDISYTEHAFCDSYRAYMAARPTDYPSVLIGDAGAWNRLHGHPVPPPVLIGDPEVARLVQSAGSGGATQITDSAAQIAQLALARTLRLASPTPSPKEKEQNYVTDHDDRRKRQ
jgi:hypothetical protein